MTNNLATNLYSTLTHPDTMRGLLVNFFRDSRDQAVALLQKNGVAIANSAPVKTVQIAWLKALKDSQDFRSQATDTLTHYVTVVKAKAPGGTTNFAGDVSRVYYNDVSDGYLYGDPGTGLTGTVPGGAATTATPAPASTSSGSFWDTLGSIFTPKVIQAGIGTGLQAYSTSLTAAANASSEKNALTLEQQRLAQAQLAAQTQGGLSTGWVVAIVLISLTALVTGILLVSRKRKNNG